MTEKKKRVAIIGGGISGLAAAYELEKTDMEVTLLERNDRLGGTIHTVREDGFVIEGGPDSFFTLEKPWAADLCSELGLRERLASVWHKDYYVYSGGRLHRSPLGLRLTIPTRMRPIWKTKLLSFDAKMAMFWERFQDPRVDARDETIASFVTRHFGKEVNDKIAEPVMAGIYVAPASRLSIQATFPRLVELEREYGSLRIGLKKEAKKLLKPGRKVKKKGQRRGSKGVMPLGRTRQESLFLTLRGGLGEMVDAIASRLQKTRIRTGCAVRQLEAGYRIHMEGGVLEVEHLVLAVPAPEAARLVRPFAPRLADALARIPAVGSATVSLGYEAASFEHPLDASGYVIPVADRRHALACTWSSQKFGGRAPDGHVLLRCFFGGADDPQAVDLEDDELTELTHEEIRTALSCRGEPVLAKVFRWPEANPIYEVGHLERVAKIDSLLPLHMYVTGSAYHGIGISECVRESTETARAVAPHCFKEE